MDVEYLFMGYEATSPVFHSGKQQHKIVIIIIIKQKMATEPKLAVKFHPRAGRGPTGSGRKELRIVFRRKGRNREDSLRLFSIRR